MLTWKCGSVARPRLQEVARRSGEFMWHGRLLFVDLTRVLTRAWRSETFGIILYLAALAGVAAATLWVKRQAYGVRTVVGGAVLFVALIVLVRELRRLRRSDE